MEIINLRKRYKNRHRKVDAVDGVSFELPGRGLVFVLGESGSGKTTLLNLLSLQEKPTSGKILVDGKDICALHGKRKDALRNSHFAILFQDLNLLSEFSVFDNLNLAREIQGRKLERGEAESALARFGLGGEILDEMPDNLSGGQRQRVALARAVAKDFRVLVADEPTGSLDSANAEAVAGAMKEISRDRLVVATTHDEALAKRYADRIVRMERGRIVGDTAPTGDSNGAEAAERPSGGRTRAPLKAISKLALHGVFHSAPRFVFSLLSCVLTLSVFMETLSFCSYDETDAAYRLFKEEGIEYAEIICYEKVDSGYLSVPMFNLNNTSEITSLFGPDYSCTMTLYDVKNSQNYNGGQRLDSGYCFPNSDAAPFGFDVVGRLPKPGGDLEIALTKYDCLLLGWLDESSVDDAEALKNIVETKTYKIDFSEALRDPTVREAKVVGIVDTDFRPNPNPNGDMEEMVEHERALCEISEGVIFDPVLFKKLVQVQSKGAILLHVPVSVRPLEIVERYNHHMENNGHQVLKCKTRVENVIYKTSNFQHGYAPVAIALTAILTVVTAFSLISLTASSIQDLGPSVDVLRSMGISSPSANAIYALETAIVSLGCGALSIFPYFLFNRGVAAFVRDKLLLTVSPFAFRWWIVLASVAAMLAFSLLVTAIVVLIRGAKPHQRYVK